MEAWINKLYETFIETEYYKLLLEGLGNTLITRQVASDGRRPEADE